MLNFQQVKSVVEVPKFALEGLSSAEFTALRSDFHAFGGENALYESRDEDYGPQRVGNQAWNDQQEAAEPHCQLAR